MNQIMEGLNMHVVVYVVKFEPNLELVLSFFFWGLWGDMGDSDNKKNKAKMSRSEMERFSLDTSRFSRDFLTRFMGSSNSSREKEEELDDEEIELNLGLSLGGRFGVDKSSSNNNMLIRSSSIAACFPIVRDDNDVTNLENSNTKSPSKVAYSSLIRTSSLPVETEEEWRKRKELQTLRRMAAKRRRSEKQRNLKVEKEGEEENIKDNFVREQYLAAAKKFSSSVATPVGWAATGRGVGAVLGGGGIDVGAMAKAKGSFLGGNLGQLLSQRSVESQHGGRGSSSSELESNKSFQGSSSCGDLSPGSNQSSQKGNEQDAGSSRTKAREGAGKTSLAEMENPSRQTDTAKNKGKETKANTLGDMPCVFTKGDGPNGRRVEGILYKYGKGEEVRIMCVCHGSFLSPAEFVKHAGGTDVTHPLKHIVVNPNASPFL